MQGTAPGEGQESDERRSGSATCATVGCPNGVRAPARRDCQVISPWLGSARGSAGRQTQRKPRSSRHPLSPSPAGHHSPGEQNSRCNVMPAPVLSHRQWGKNRLWSLVVLQRSFKQVCHTDMVRVHGPCQRLNSRAGPQATSRLAWLRRRERGETGEARLPAVARQSTHRLNARHSVESCWGWYVHSRLMLRLSPPPHHNVFALHAMYRAGG